MDRTEVNESHRMEMFDAEDNEETEVVKEYEKDEAAMEESAEKEETI